MIYSHYYYVFLLLEERLATERIALAEMEKQFIGTHVTTDSFEIRRVEFMKEVMIERAAKEAAKQAAKKVLYIAYISNLIYPSIFLSILSIFLHF